MNLNKFNIIIFGFFSLLLITIFFASLFENFIERVIINYLAPGAFYSIILIYFVYLIVTTILPWFRKGDTKIKEDYIYNLLIIGSLSGVLVAYSTSKSTEKVINNNMDIMVEKYVVNNERTQYLSEEINKLNRDIQGLREGIIIIDGLQNVKMKIRDYVVSTKPNKINLVFTTDNWFLSNPELKELMEYISGLHNVVPNFSVDSYIFLKNIDSLTIQNHFKKLSNYHLHFQDGKLGEYNKSISEIVNRHHQTIFGILGNYECIFLVTPTGQLNNEFQAKFLIKTSSDMFENYKNTLKNGIVEFQKIRKK